MDAVNMILSAAISAVITGFIGFAIRASIERKLETAHTESIENRRKRIRFTEARSAWMWAAGRVLYHLVRIAQNRATANGDLENAFARLESAEAEMKGIERSYAAEAQED